MANNDDVARIAEEVYQQYGDTPSGRREARRRLRQAAGDGFNLVGFVQLLQLLFAVLAELDERKNDDD